MDKFDYKIKSKDEICVWVPPQETTEGSIILVCLGRIGRFIRTTTRPRILVAAAMVFIGTLKSDLGLLLKQLTHGVAIGAEFENYEIRVIRPRYFSKRGRFELGLGGFVVTNQTFIHTYAGALNLTYHLNEQLALELSGSYGFSIDKDDKEILQSNNFGIRTQIIRVQTQLEAAILYAPIYGKYQLSSGRLIYFDTFLLAGAGLSGVEYAYDHCLRKDEVTPERAVDIIDPSDPTVYSYPTVSFGLGQRYFLNKRDSIKWDVRDHFFLYDRADGDCPEEPSATDGQHSITMQMGLSRYF